LGFNIAQEVHQIFMALLEKEVCSIECPLLAHAVNNLYISKDHAEGDVLKSSTANPGYSGRNLERS